MPENYRLVEVADVAPNTTVRRFDARYWGVNFPFNATFACIGSWVSDGAAEGKSFWTFKSNRDLGGLIIWQSRYYRDHAYNTVGVWNAGTGFPESTDWRGNTLSMHLAFFGIRPISGVLGAPSLTVVLTDASTYIIDLSVSHTGLTISGAGDEWDLSINWSTVMAGAAHATDFDRTIIDYAFISMIPDEYDYGQCTLAAGYTAPGTTIDVHTGNNLAFKVNDSLTVGADTRTITNVVSLGSGNYRLTISALPFNYLSGQACYVASADSRVTYLPAEIDARVEITEIATAGSSVDIDVPAREVFWQPHRAGAAAGYDNHADISPERLVNQLVTGQFTRAGLFAMYIGFKYMKCVWDTTDPVVDEPGYTQGGRWIVNSSSAGLTYPVREWWRGLLRRSAIAGLKPVFLNSFEILKMNIPKTWAQRNALGEKHQFNYTPPSSLLDPTVLAAHQFLIDIFQDYADLLVEESLSLDEWFLPALGEPSWGPFTSPCFYSDSATLAFASEKNFNLSGTIYSITGATRTLARSSGTFTNVVDGMWVKLAGFANAANNAWAKVLSHTNTTLVLDTPLRVDETAVATMSRPAGGPSGGGPYTESFQVTAATNRITATTQYLWQFLIAGQQVTMSGFANAGNNGTWTIVSIDAGGYFATFEAPAGALVNEAAGPSVTIKRTIQKYTSINDNIDQTAASLDRVSLDWTSERLGEAIRIVMNEAKVQGSLETRLLLLPDQFNAGAAEILQYGNRPDSGAIPSIVDILILEDYNAISNGPTPGVAPDLALHAANLSYVKDTLGFTRDKTEYFAGFVVTAAQIDDWLPITDALMESLHELAFNRSYIWATTQMFGRLDAVDGNPSYVFDDPPLFVKVVTAPRPSIKVFHA